jgi:hypothetical protein
LRKLQNLSLRAQRGNLVAIATADRRRVFSLIEIATWFDRLTMSGFAPRNDRGTGVSQLSRNGIIQFFTLSAAINPA